MSTNSVRFGLRLHETFLGGLMVWHRLDLEVLSRRSVVTQRALPICQVEWASRSTTQISRGVAQNFLTRSHNIRLPLYMTRTIVSMHVCVNKDSLTVKESGCGKWLGPCIGVGEGGNPLLVWLITCVVPSLPSVTIF